MNKVSQHQRAAHGKFFYRSQVFLMYLPGIPGNFIKIIDLLLRMLKNFLSPPPKFKVCRFSTKKFFYDGNPLAVVGNNLGISFKIITFASNIINFLMTLMKDSSRSWIVMLSLSCGLCTATHMKVTIIFFWGCNQVAKCSVSAVPETDVAKQAIFLQILHAHPTINHFIASQQRGNPIAMKRERKRDRVMASWVFAGYIIVVHHKFCKSSKGVAFEREGIKVQGLFLQVIIFCHCSVSKRKLFKHHSGCASRQSYQHYCRGAANASLLLLKR